MSMLRLVSRARSKYSSAACGCRRGAAGGCTVGRERSVRGSAAVSWLRVCSRHWARHGPSCRCCTPTPPVLDGHGPAWAGRQMVASGLMAADAFCLCCSVLGPCCRCCTPAPPVLDSHGPAWAGRQKVAYGLMAADAFCLCCSVLDPRDKTDECGSQACKLWLSSRCCMPSPPALTCTGLYAEKEARDSESPEPVLTCTR